MPHLLRQAPSALVSLILALCIPVAAGARRSGIAGFSGNPATNGGATCNQCHSGGLAPSVDLTGPTIVAVGETRSYSLSISGGQEVACSLGVSAAVGTLTAVETGTRLREGEVTHTSKRFVDANGECLYGFDWTAPAFGGTFRLYASGNSVNFDGQLTGDRATSVWLEIEVTGAPPINQPPIANAGDVVERYTPAGPNHLAYEATIEDPAVYTRPWKISLPLYRRMEPDLQLMDFKCVEFVEALLYGEWRRRPLD